METRRGYDGEPWDAVFAALKKFNLSFEPKDPNSLYVRSGPSLLGTVGRDEQGRIAVVLKTRGSKLEEAFLNSADSIAYEPNFRSF